MYRSLQSASSLAAAATGSTSAAQRLYCPVLLNAEQISQLVAKWSQLDVRASDMERVMHSVLTACRAHEHRWSKAQITPDVDTDHAGRGDLSARVSLSQLQDALTSFNLFAILSEALSTAAR